MIHEGSFFLFTCKPCLRSLYSLVAARVTFARRSKPYLQAAVAIARATVATAAAADDIIKKHYATLPTVVARLDDQDAEVRRWAMGVLNYYYKAAKAASSHKRRRF